MNYLEKITLFKRSGTAGVWLHTYEENQSIEGLAALAKKQGMAFFAFNPAQGLKQWLPGGGMRFVKVVPPKREIASLREIRASDGDPLSTEYGAMNTNVNPDPQSDEQYLTCEDLNNSFDSAILDALRVKAGGGKKPGDNKVMVVITGIAENLIDNPVLMSMIKVRIDEYKVNNSMLIILSESDQVPPALSRVVRLIRKKLPTKDELAVICDACIAKVPKKIQAESIVPGRTEIISSLAGLTHDEAENVISFCLIRDRLIDASRIAQEKSTILAQDGMLEFCEANEGFDQFGGYGAVTDYIKKRKRLYSQEARDFNAPKPKGILLIGPPGCGKTLLCKIIANELCVPFCNFRIDRVFGGIIGETEKNMRRVLDQLLAMSPVVAALDEIEKALSGSQSSGQTDGGVTARMMGMLLSWMSDQKEGVYMVGTCNSIGDLPPELTRKGRFDEIFYVGLPNIGERRKIAQVHISKRKRDYSLFDLDAISDATNNMTGAEIEECVNVALVEAFNDNKEIDTTYIINAATGMTRSAMVFGEKLSQLETWAAKHGVKNASYDEQGAVILPNEGTRNLEFEY